MGHYLMLGLGLGLVAVIQPGPFQAYLLAQSLHSGWRRTLPAALAPLLSDGPIVVLVLVLLNQLPPWFLPVLSGIGGIFILFLAWGSFQALRRPASGSERPSEGSLLKATLMNFLNPNPYIFWATVTGPIVIEAWRQTPSWALSFGLGFYGALVGGFAGFILLFASAGSLDPRLSRALASLSTVGLFLFGLKLLWSGLIMPG